MRKKEPWMYKGATVSALGRKTTITKMQENSIDGVDYVYYIYCRPEGEKNANPYYPIDVAQYFDRQTLTTP